MPMTAQCVESCEVHLAFARTQRSSHQQLLSNSPAFPSQGA